MPLPDRGLQGVPGVLSAAALARTADAIVAVQQPSGALPWPDGHTDVWDHVECAMALLLAGDREAALRGWAWVEATQRPDGLWATSYDGLAVLDASVDTNQCAYVAVGAWQWWLVTGDDATVRRLWPLVRSALSAVVALQAPGGQLQWSVGPDGVVNADALLTGSSSTYQALRCGIALAELVGDEQPEWELAAGRLQHAVAHHPEVFLDKSRFSMDWYYPVLGGALRGAAGRARLASRWREFVLAGVGIRCVVENPWYTGAESAELALALAATGRPAEGLALLADIQHLREADGSYWTGVVLEGGVEAGLHEGVRWPAERSSWTAAAVILAADALAGGPTLELFAGDRLPTGVLLGAEVCREPGAACAVTADRGTKA